jgi:hypothetical protein
MRKRTVAERILAMLPPEALAAYEHANAVLESRIQTSATVNEPATPSEPEHKPEASKHQDHTATVVEMVTAMRKVRGLKD